MPTWPQATALRQSQDHAAELERKQELAWIETKNLEARYRHDFDQKDQQTRDVIATAHADAARARAVSAGVQRDMASFIEAHRYRAQAAAAAGQCAPNDTTAMVLADLFSRADDAAGELAAAFDEARARGLGCEASYGTVAGGN